MAHAYNWTVDRESKIHTDFDRHKGRLTDSTTVGSAKAADPLEAESERNCIHNAGRSENREMCDHGCERARGGIDIASDHEMEPRRAYLIQKRGASRILARENITGCNDACWHGNRWS